VNAALKALAALAVLLATTPSAQARPALFGTVEFRAESLAALPRWQRVMARIEDERPIYDLCRETPAACPSRSAGAWQSMVRTQAGRPPQEQLRVVNRFFNAWPYRTDLEVYGKSDYWASPLEFLRNSGDCEDYAIIKYVTLRQLGFEAEQLRMVVVRDTQRDLAHAVLAVYLEREVYILDNLSNRIMAHHEVSHYVPYYSVNETTRWAHVSPQDPLVSQLRDAPLPTAAGQGSAASGS
jgi:predicted transglutaminase-like cysteine proteinase